MCELVMDDVMVAQANVVVGDEGLIVDNEAGLGSCKFNGEGYTCTKIVVNHPSHHTIENIQADAEVIAIFTNPTGKFLCVSSLVRANSAQTPATHFFNSFVGFGDTTKPYTTVNLGENWGLNMMIPSAGSYYVYDGTSVFPPCVQSKWVVFKAMINMDPNDFANLVKTNAPGSRSIQPLGDREVFFNDIASLPGGPMPHDNKTYMRCKRLGKKQDVKPVSSPDVKGEKSKATAPSGITKFVSDMYSKNEAMQVLDVILLIAAVVLGAYAAFQAKNAEFLVTPAMYTESLGVTIRGYLFYVFQLIYGFYKTIYDAIFNPAASVAAVEGKTLGTAASALFFGNKLTNAV
jgi:carbonic anhydrase